MFNRDAVSFLGYGDSGRNGDSSMEDTWMQQKNWLRNMEIIEKIQLYVSIIMYKKSGELVLNDELIGSRSSDAECKTTTHKNQEARDLAQMIVPIHM